MGAWATRLSMFSDTNIQVDSTAKLELTVDEVYFLTSSL